MVAGLLERIEKVDLANKTLKKLIRKYIYIVYILQGKEWSFSKRFENKKIWGYKFNNTH